MVMMRPQRRRWLTRSAHAWPGKSQPAFERTVGHGITDVDATNLMLSFFDHKT